jgi:hypothetical protein
MQPSAAGGVEQRCSVSRHRHAKDAASLVPGIRCSSVLGEAISRQKLRSLSL